MKIHSEECPSQGAARDILTQEFLGQGRLKHIQLKNLKRIQQFASDLFFLLLSSFDS